MTASPACFHMSHVVVVPEHVWECTLFNTVSGGTHIVGLQSVNTHKEEEEEGANIMAEGKGEAALMSLYNELYNKVARLE